MEQYSNTAQYLRDANAGLTQLCCLIHTAVPCIQFVLFALKVEGGLARRGFSRTAAPLLFSRSTNLFFHLPVQNRIHFARLARKHSRAMAVSHSACTQARAADTFLYRSRAPRRAFVRASLCVRRNYDLRRQADST